MLSTLDALMHSLTSILGPDRLTADPAALDSCLIDGRKPRLVVAPQTAEQVAATLRVCSEARATMVPRGGGTALALGNPPRRVDVVIKLHGLDRIVEHDSANLTVSAQCGISVKALQSALAAQNQFVPIDAPLPQKTTVGGVVAANLNGPRRAGYGSVRDLVVGMKVVLANGEQIKAGGKVVKNVAGYDMCKLFVGSLGTLGIITEVTLRVAPIADTTATLVGSGDLTRVEDFYRRLLRSVLTPAAAFIARDGAAERWRIGVWCDGFADSVERQLGDLKEMAARSGLSGDLLSAEKHYEFWDPVRDFPLATGRLIYRVMVPPAELFGFVKLVEGWHEMAIACDAATGTIWLACAAHTSGLQRFSYLAATARERRGYAVIFAAPAALKTGVNVWGASAPSFSLMREIKRQFDPDALLNPGRFAGNL